jgi:hypothetical protein
MTFHKTILAAAVPAATLLAVPAQAAWLLDTGTPDNSGFAQAVNADQGLAMQFSVAGPQLIDAVQAYLADPFQANQGATFLLNLYGNSGSGATALPGALLYSQTASFAADGWNGASGLGWSVGPGLYWAAVEVASGDFSDLVAPVHAPAANPATAFSTFSTYGRYDHLDIGLRVSAVPEPGSWVLLVAGIGAVAAAARRRPAP